MSRVWKIDRPAAVPALGSAPASDDALGSLGLWESRCLRVTFKIVLHGFLVFLARSVINRVLLLVAQQALTFVCQHESRFHKVSHDHIDDHSRAAPNLLGTSDLDRRTAFRGAIRLGSRPLHLARTGSLRPAPLADRWHRHLHDLPSPPDTPKFQSEAEVA